MAAGVADEDVVEAVSVEIDGLDVGDPRVALDGVADGFGGEEAGAVGDGGAGEDGGGGRRGGAAPEEGKEGEAGCRSAGPAQGGAAKHHGKGWSGGSEWGHEMKKCRKRSFRHRGTGNSGGRWAGAGVEGWDQNEKVLESCQVIPSAIRMAAGEPSGWTLMGMRWALSPTLRRLSWMRQSIFLVRRRP